MHFWGVFLIVNCALRHWMSAVDLQSLTDFYTHLYFTINIIPEKCLPLHSCSSTTVCIILTFFVLFRFMSHLSFFKILPRIFVSQLIDTGALKPVKRGFWTKVSLFTAKIRHIWLNIFTQLSVYWTYLKSVQLVLQNNTLLYFYIYNYCLISSRRDKKQPEELS